ncbi:MAG: hydantoinase/oxoprolinase family protein, partial [Candidatus Margulisiibacteriota bacterium]
MINKPQYRIGIDVGGTFTHAVALDSATYELSGQVKVPTTHSSQNGVAGGIIDSLRKLLSDCSINPSDVVFIAHSTTQATNALLEGDVCSVGIIGIGKGIEGVRVKGETNVGDIDLGGGKKIKVFYEYIDKDNLNNEEIRGNTVEIHRNNGCGAIVAAEAFSVDDPGGEKSVIEIAGKLGIPATGTHEISGLYGLRIRTRTAVINASILPKMLETAKATDDCVKKSGIKAPLMIMRSDGGVMSIDEVSKRPILTILSGPAAGIASALLYVKISDGIFLEVGGTSTDIAVIKAGRAAVRTARIGGHKVYLRTLDSRTVGIAGGSMPVISNGSIVDVGPR